MPVPQFLSDLLALLYAIATPAATLTLIAAGLSLRTEGGMNFHLNGRTGKWIMWTVILLTLPQILHWIGAQGIHVPDNPGGISSSWISTDAQAFQNFVSIVVSHFVPVAAAFMVLKATLDAAGGENPLPSIIAAIFLLSITATKLMLQSWNSGSDTATTDMLQQLWNYMAGTVMPSAAGLAVVGAVINFVQRKPFARLIFAAIGFPPLPSLVVAFKERDAITACFDEEGQHMLEGSSEPTVCVVFSPKKTDEVKHAVRVIERFVSFNTELFELVEMLQGWEKENAGSDSNRGEPSLRAA